MRTRRTDYNKDWEVNQKEMSKFIIDLIRKDDLKNAYKYIKIFLGKYPDDPWGIYWCGKVLHEWECYDAACFYLNQLFGTKKELEARIELFRIFLDQRNYSIALSYVTDVIKEINNSTILEQINLVTKYVNSYDKVNKNDSYLEKQYSLYDRKKALERFLHEEEIGYLKRSDRIPSKQLFSLIENKIATSVPHHKLELADAYYFYLPNMLYKGEYFNYLKVKTLPDKKDILMIKPILKEDVLRRTDEVINLIGLKDTKRLVYKID